MINNKGIDIVYNSAISSKVPVCKRKNLLLCEVEHAEVRLFLFVDYIKRNVKEKKSH